MEVPKEINTRYKRLTDGILKYPAENGLWHTVMNRPDFYQETSGSAGIAGGIKKAVRLHLPEPGAMASALKAMEGGDHKNQSRRRSRRRTGRYAHYAHD